MGISLYGQNQPPAAVSVSPSSGSGTYQRFTLNFSDPNGYADLSYPEVIINTSFNGGNACYVIYDRLNNQALLVNDSGSGSTGAVLGSGGSAQNSQCIVYGIGSSAAASGNNESITLNIGFKQAFYGAKNIYLYTSDAGGLTAGPNLAGHWDPEATVTVNPSTISSTPSSGSGSSGTFSFAYFDPNGASDLSSPEVIFAAGLSGVGACYVVYDQISNVGLLVNDSSTGSTPVRFGTSDTAANGQCVLSGSGSSAVTAGGLLIFNLALTFNQSFGSTAPKNIYLYTYDLAGLVSGFQTAGTWSVPAFTNQAPSVISVSPSSGSGSAQSFTLTFSDPNGYADLFYPEVILNSSFNGGNACFVIYDRLNYRALLVNDSGSGSTAVRMETTDVAQNSHCTLNGSGSSASGTGTVQTVIVNLAFAASFTGTQNTYLYTADVGGLTSVQAVGQWTVPVTIPPDFVISVSNASYSVNPLVIAPGLGAYAVVAAAPVGPFAGTVTFSVTSNDPTLPSGYLYLFTSGSTYLNIVAPSTPTSYQVTVTGVSGTITHAVTFTIDVIQSGPGFWLSMNPTSVMVAAGNAASFLAQVNPVGGFVGSTVGNFHDSGLPAGAMGTFSAPSFVGGLWTTTLTVTTTGSLPGTYAVGISADNGNGLTSSISAALVVGSGGGGGGGGGGSGQQTITSSPAGLSLTVDGVNCISPCSFQWTVGTNHTIGTFAAQAIGTGTQYLFSRWSDGGAITHTITANSSGAYSASFTTQYLLTTAVSTAGAGTITPASGWYNAGSVVTVSAAANGQPFSGFSGNLTGTATPQNVSMNAPQSVTASFGADFALSTPPPQTVPVGQSINNIPVTIIPLGGFSSAVGLSFTNTNSWPTGLSAAFAQTPTTSSTSISVVTSSVTPRGFYMVSFAGSGGNVSHSASLAVVVGGNVAPASAIYAYNSGQAVTFPDSCTGFNCTSFTSCSVFNAVFKQQLDQNVTASPIGQTASTWTLSVTANTNAAPGPRFLICYATIQGYQYPFSATLSVYDATPTITGISPPQIFYPGTTSVSFIGFGFGIAPPSLQFTPGGVSWQITSNSPASFTALLTPSAPGMYSVLVMSSGEGSSGFFQAGGPVPSQSQSSPAQVQVLSTPQLSCTGLVSRGDAVTCTVAGTSAANVTSWQFTGGGATVTGPSGTATWSGPMVVGGTVQVSVSGSTPLQQTVTVNPRSWHTQPASPVKVNNGSLVTGGMPITLPVPPVPSGLDSNLGVSGWTAAYSGLNLTTIASGPNAGFTYFAAQLSYTAFFFQYIINPDLVDSSSNFSTHQCGANGYIGWSDLLAQTERHEYNSLLQSHWVFYSNSMNTNNPGDYVEGSVATPGSDLNVFKNNYTNGLNALFTQIQVDTAQEPYPVNYNEMGQPLGNINYGPNYANCN